MVPTNTFIQRYLCAVYYYAEKEDLSKGYGNQKRTLRITMHFLCDK